MPYRSSHEPVHFTKWFNLGVDEEGYDIEVEAQCEAILEGSDSEGWDLLSFDVKLCRDEEYLRDAVIAKINANMEDFIQSAMENIDRGG